MGAIGITITLVSFAGALVAISGSIAYVTNKVTKIEADTLKCLREIQDLHREMYHWFDTVGGETRHTRKITHKKNYRRN